MLEELDATTMDAIGFAVARGWVVVQAGHSICLPAAIGGIRSPLDAVRAAIVAEHMWQSI